MLQNICFSIKEIAMPPKAKFTREEVISAAFEIVRTEGYEALTARALGQKLNSSARPLFTLFGGMDEIRGEVTAMAKKVYDGYIDEGLKNVPAFKGVGTAYIRFAAEQSKLFDLLFMREQTGRPTKDSVLGMIDDNVDVILRSVMDGYGLSVVDARRVYLHLWIYSHGIAVLIATKVCAFTADEISEMLTQVFVGLLKKLKTDGKL